jgi:Uri superfamily endonuclease
MLCPITNGIYTLLIKVKNNKNILVGKLGNIEFKKGFYVYIGSAQNNLKARIKRHLRKNKKIFWHIDYLTSHQGTQIIEVWILSDNNRRKECEVAEKFYKEVSPCGIIRNFGSSDCKCPSHLFYFKNKRNKVRTFLKKSGFKKILNEGHLC